MIWIILATGFGAANFIAIALLFRRVKKNTRQLSDMRAERNSEWILHALQGAPEARERPVRVAGGGSHPLPLHPRPVRRKEHLRLYNGGAAIAATFMAMSAIIRYGRQSHGAQIVSTALGATTVAATAITAMTVTPWQQHIETVPPRPSSTVTTTQSPGPGSPATPTAPTPGVRTRANTPTPTAGTHRGAPRTPEPGNTIPSTATPSTGSTAGSPPQSVPADVVSPTATATASADATAAESGTCVAITVLAAHACLAGGG